jgi:preprotein translocase subunit YajC
MSIDTKERLQSTILLVLLCITIFSFIAYVAQQKNPAQLIIKEKELMSLIEIQKMLNELEPENPIEADGIYGNQTKVKWERVWMNQQAKKYIEGNE